MDKETAEQKLLKLIESSSPSEAAPKPSGQQAAQQIAQAVHGHGFSILDISSVLRSFVGLEKIFPGGHGRFSFGLKEINKVLVGLIATIFIFLFIDFLSGMKSLQKKIDLAVEPHTTKTLSNIILPVKNLDDYLAPVESRNIFLPYEKKVIETKTAAESQTQKITAMTEKLKLVGISWFDSPETASVMMEDKESGITYFVHQGEKVKDLTVKIIYADRVVLIYEGEEITIKL